jgi:hypothetical protein
MVINIENPNGVKFLIDGEAGITVYVDGESRFVPKDSKDFARLILAINDGDEEGVRTFSEPPVVKVCKFLAETNGELVLDEDGRIVDKDDKVIENYATFYVKEMMDKGIAPAPILRFMERLRNNPSSTAQKEVPQWMEAGRMAITPDGYILAYKKVNPDFTSIHDGTTKNDVGTIVEMPRGAVDDVRERTCSHGLHFCSADYLPQFGNCTPGGFKVVLLKIDPADVVSIPSDYDNTKGRACRYAVIKDVTDEFEHLKNKLNNNPVYDYGEYEEEDDYDDYHDVENEDFYEEKMNEAQQERLDALFRQLFSR